MQVPTTSLQRTLDIVALLALIAYIAYMVVVWPGLPDRIPIHFDGAGNPDGYGSKMTLLGLPLLSIGIYVLFNFLNRRPQTFNYPVPINEENAVQQYTMAKELMSLLKTGIIFTFYYITWRTVLTARGEAEGLGSWFMPVFLAVTILPAVVYYLRAVQSR